MNAKPAPLAAGTWVAELSFVMVDPRLLPKEPPGRYGEVADVQGWRTGDIGTRPARRLPCTPTMKAGTHAYRRHKKSAIGAIAPISAQVAKPGPRICGDGYRLLSSTQECKVR